MQKILVVAVHPDDETLGCGGTLLKHKAQGDEIHWMIVTRMSAESGFLPEVIARREKEIETVAKMYEFDGVHRLGFTTTRLDEVPMSQLVTAMSKVFQNVQPSQVLLPFLHDVHSDHQYAFNAAFSCTKSFRYPSVRKVMMIETLSETNFSQSVSGGFVPNMFVDISDQFLRKMDILQIYKSELGIHPYPRSKECVTALATLRGATAGCKYAESFILLKEIV